MPVAYPANYGSLTQSLAGDGDPLDVVFYTRAPMAPGTLIKLRAIGVLKMIDGGEKDDKIIAVPASKIDPTYDDIKNISDLPLSRSGCRPFSASISSCLKGVKRWS
jgi:inorganic pyrophosphatase